MMILPRSCLPPYLVLLSVTSTTCYDVKYRSYFKRKKDKGHTLHGSNTDPSSYPLSSLLSLICYYIRMACRRSLLLAVSSAGLVAVGAFQLRSTGLRLDWALSASSPRSRVVETDDRQPLGREGVDEVHQVEVTKGRNRWLESTRVSSRR